MKRELKGWRPGADHTKCYSGYRTIPYEEGTESLLHIQPNPQMTGYRTIPYEEGTERKTGLSW